MTITTNLPDEPLAALREDEDDEKTAVEEALAELEAGQVRPFAEFAEEFSARFAAPVGLHRTECDLPLAWR